MDLEGTLEGLFLKGPLKSTSEGSLQGPFGGDACPKYVKLKNWLKVIVFDA